MIHRDDHKELYVIITNDVLRDKKLSLAARGLLGFMLTFSDDWIFNIENLKEQTGATTYEIRSTLAELKSAGYVTITQTKTKHGKFSSCSYEVFEVPCVELPHAEKPPDFCLPDPRPGLPGPDHTDVPRHPGAVQP